MFSQSKRITRVKRNKQPNSLSTDRGLGHDSYGINESEPHLVDFCLKKQSNKPNTHCVIYPVRFSSFIWSPKIKGEKKTSKERTLIVLAVVFLTETNFLRHTVILGEGHNALMPK